MKSFSEIETIVKRASKACGFSWGVSEEIGKNIRLLEMFGIHGIKNLDSYFNKFKDKKFQNINLIAKTNLSKEIPFCPISSGINFLDQVHILEEMKELKFENMAFPILFVPFLSRASELIGKKIFLQIDQKKLLLNFNQSIFANLPNNEVLEKGEKIDIKFLENIDSFDDIEWKNLLTLSKETFVDETDDLKKKAAGAGLTDND